MTTCFYIHVLKSDDYSPIYMNGISFEMQLKTPNRSLEMKPIPKKEHIARSEQFKHLGILILLSMSEDVWKSWLAKSCLSVGQSMFFYVGVGCVRLITFRLITTPRCVAISQNRALRWLLDFWLRARA